MAATEWCRRAMHRPVREQHKELSEKLAGHWAYYGTIGNHGLLDRFRAAVRGGWRKSLARRSAAARHEVEAL